MKTINTILTVMAVTLMVVINACTPHDALDPDYPEPGIKKEMTAYPAAFLGTIPNEIGRALLPRFTKKSSYISSETRILILHMSTMGLINPEEIKSILDHDGILVVLDPDHAVLSAWAEEHGLRYAMCLPEQKVAGASHELYAFNKSNNHFFLGYVPDDLEHSGSLNSFINWINQYAAPKPPLLTLSPNDVRALFDYQTINHTYSLYLKKEEAHVILSKPDIIEKSGQIDVKIIVYPLYAFQDQTSPGDYYVTSLTVTAHNDQMYKGNWVQMHGGVHSHLIGFFMWRLGVKTEILNSDYTSVPSAIFAVKGTPVPTTTIGATSYTHGFSWSLGGAVSGSVGTTTGVGATVSGEISVENSETRLVSDIEIDNTWSGSTANFMYNVKNGPSMSTVTGITDPPRISVTNAEFYQDWIWQVPSTKDNGKEQFLLRNTIAPVYSSGHFFSSFADAVWHNWDDAVQGSSSFTYLLTPPSRTPSGKLEINNSGFGEWAQYYFTNVQIWKSTSSASQPDYTIPGSFAPGQTMTTNLPVGSYKILIQAGLNLSSLSTYHTDVAVPIQITRGGTAVLNSGFDFIKGGF